MEAAWAKRLEGPTTKLSKVYFEFKALSKDEPPGFCVWGGKVLSEEFAVLAGAKRCVETGSGIRIENENLKLLSPVTSLTAIEIILP